MKCLLYSRDLMFSSQVSGAAAKASVALETLTEEDQLWASVDDIDDDYLVLVDLTTPGLDIDTLARRLKAQQPRPASVIAVGPHVHAQKLAAAGDAGCDYVLTKGQASRELAELLATFR